MGTLMRIIKTDSCRVDGKVQDIYGFCLPKAELGKKDDVVQALTGLQSVCRVQPDEAGVLLWTDLHPSGSLEFCSEIVRVINEILGTDLVVSCERFGSPSASSFVFVSGYQDMTYRSLLKEPIVVLPYMLV
jgi:hypothetical protein